MIFHFLSARYRDHFVYAPSQWETTLLSNVISHWLGAYTKWSLKILFQLSNDIGFSIGLCGVKVIWDMIKFIANHHNLNIHIWDLYECIKQNLDFDVFWINPWIIISLQKSKTWAMCQVFGDVFDLTYSGWDKRTPFRRWHFQLHFLEWKCLNSN